MKKILDKKGQVGFRLAQSIFLILVILVVLGVAGILSVVSLRDAGIFTAGTLEYNQTDAITANYSEGIADFFGNTGTIISILVVVIIISLIGVVILVISVFGRGRGGAGQL